MHNLLMLAAAITVVTTVPISSTATAVTRTQCNAGYAECLAVCGNRAVGGMTPQAKELSQACSNSCENELSTCLANASDRKKGRK